MNHLKKIYGGMTIYRTMLYFLAFLLGLAAVLSFFEVTPHSTGNILLQSILFPFFCWMFNNIIAHTLNASKNLESSIITGLILALIVGPLSLPGEWLALVFISLMAMASKYIIAKNKSHILNPAAFGVLASALLGYVSVPFLSGADIGSSWWVGNATLAPAVIVGGLVVMHKIKRFHLGISFLAVYLILLLGEVAVSGSGLQVAGETLKSLGLYSPLLFFMLAMLVEPVTSPQKRKGRVAFGGIVGTTLFAVQKFASQIPFAFELSLLVGNIFTRLIEKVKLYNMELKKKEKLSPQIEGFWFKLDKPVEFSPGQFFEYTLPHSNPDSRGTRRYFTIASSPTEDGVLLATRFAEKNGSSFKQALKNMKKGDEITAHNVAGEFTLPKNENEKLLFIAGGIGITPFRSMAKYLADIGEERDIVLIYGARDEKDFVFKDVFEKANFKTVYNTEIISKEIIKNSVSDLDERTIFISGPEAMVKAIEKELKELGIPKKQVETDYFPGY